jgi:hypothetical protein
MDFQRQTGAAVAWIALFAMLTCGSVYQRVTSSGTVVVTATAEAAR